MQRSGDDLLAQLAVADADGGGLLRHEAGGRHAGQGVDLEKPQLARVVEDEVGARIGRQVQRAEHRQRGIGQTLLGLGRDLRRGDLLGSTGLVLVAVVIEADRRGGLEKKYRSDDYLNMMAQTLCDRLAEATAEKLHEEVRRSIWGYAPGEQLSIEDQHLERYQGIRPAIGYPSLPDTSANFIIDQLIDMSQVGIRLTTSGMMTPHASVSGLMFAHPKSRYFELGRIGDDQLRDYAQRRGVPVQAMKTYLQSSLIKK